MEVQLSGLAQVVLTSAAFVAGYLYCLFSQGPNDPPEDGDYLVTTKEQFNQFLRKAQGMVSQKTLAL